MSFFLFLNTDDRVSGSQIHDARFNLGYLQASNLLNYSISLESVQIPNNVYPLNATRGNNVLYFQENNATGTTYSGTFTSTNFTGTTFATEVQSILNTNTGNAYVYTVSYDSFSKKITISEASNNPFRIVTGPLTAHRELGWDVDVSTSFVTASTQMDNPVSLAGTNYIDIMTNVSNSNISTTTSSNVLYRVPLGVPYGQIVFYQNSSADYIRMSSEDLTDLNIYLRDDRGKSFELPSNTSISYVWNLTTT